MRILRWGLGGLAALIVALLLAAWVLPALLDWNRYRDGIEALATDTLGRPVRIDGPITLTLLPRPQVTADGVAIDQGGGGLRMKAAALRLRVGLAALLRGRIDARELVLHGVDMRLPWPLPKDVSPLGLLLRPPGWFATASARIEGGRLEIGDLIFNGVDLTLTSAPLTGTSMVAGAASISGQTWHFSARLQPPGADGASALDLTLEGQGGAHGVGVAVAAQIARGGDLSGLVSLHGPDLSALLPAPKTPFTASGRLTVAGGLLAADELAVTLGAAPAMTTAAQGALALRLLPAPRLDVALTSNRLDLDAWAGALLRGAGAGGMLAARLPIGVDLSAQAAQLAGGTLRDLRGAFDIAAGVVTVRELGARLPGDAALRLTGRLGGAASAAGRFEGQARLDAPALRTTLDWLRGAGFAVASALPDGVMLRAGLAGHVVVTPGAVALDHLTGQLDGQPMTGSLAVQLGAHPRLGAGLAFDRLDLDPWLAPWRGGLPSDFPAAVTARLGGFDVDLRVEARQAVLGGATIAPLLLDAGAESGTGGAGGRLILRKLDLLASGVHVAASGTFGRDGGLTEGRLDAQAAQAASVLGWLPAGLAAAARRVPALWQGPADLQVLGGGPPAKLALKVTADLADLRLEAQPVLDRPAGRWAGPVTLRHPGAPRLMAMLGLAGAASWLGDGSLSVVAQASGTANLLSADSFDLTAGTLHASGALAVQQAGGEAVVTGHVRAETLPLPLPALRSGAPLQLAALRGWQAAVAVQAGQLQLGGLPALGDVAAHLDLAHGVLRLDKVTARIGGGMLTGEVTLDAAAALPALAVEARLDGAALAGPLLDLPLDLTAGRVTAAASLRAAGHSPAALLATLQGALSLDVTNGALTGVALGAMATSPAGGGARRLADDAGLRAALAGGTTLFDRFAVHAAIDHGALRLGDAVLAAPAGSIELGGGTDLAAGTADLHLVLRPALPDPPALALRVSGPLGNLRRAPDLSDAIRWRARHALPD
ncbi:MAG: AsmA family protein [Rhodospirillales bacterium]|nr:AsmA family protein [Rhodospirillales bacterium]